MDDETERNLADAGATEALIAEFSALEGAEARLRWLARYRRGLIDGIHAEQKKLDCLDYLIFRLRNGDES